MASVSERPPRPWKDQWNELAWTGTSSPEGDVASAVANELFARDSSHAGFIASIGFFRTWYLIVACREIDRLRSTAITVRRREGDNGPRERIG